MKLVVCSICLNEEAKIAEVMKRVPEEIEGIDEIEKIVLSDGSTDNTVEEAQKGGAKVYENKSQKRLAYSFQKAVKIALARGADVMVNIDGDLQFMPEEIPKLVEPIVEAEADFVASDRFTDPETGKVRRPPNMSVGKYLGNLLGAKIVGWLSGQQFKDVTCGFRAYNKKALLSLNINSKYTYTQESFQVLASKKIEIASVPVKIKYYPGRKSRVVTSFFKFLFGSAINILRAFRDYAPLSFFFALGTPFFMLGLGGGIFILIHWLNKGAFSPYKFVGFSALYFSTLAIVIWLVGMMADMLDRVINNQEKLLKEVKEIKYGSDKPYRDTNLHNSDKND
jgi:glycosyltransferase involved in cell wall biosynthesis